MICPHCNRDIPQAVIAAAMAASRKTKGGPTSEQAKAAGKAGAAKRWAGHTSKK